MIENQLQGMTATRLRIILIFTIVLLVVLCGVGFWFFRGQLISYARQVEIDNAAASASSDDIVKLQKLKTELSDDQVAVTRAKNIVADSQHYQYQNQIIDDITAYARLSGINITGFTFNNDTPVNGTKPVATGVTPVAGPIAPANLKTTTTSITVKNPVNYETVMKFIRSIELNLTKMEVSGVSLTKASDPSQVTVNPITIEVYTR